MADSHHPAAPDGSHPAPASSPSRWAWPLLSLMALTYLVLAIGSLRQKSVTIDELGHLPAGYNYLRTADSRFCSLNPPLINVLSALPLFCMDLTPSDQQLPTFSPNPYSFWGNGYRFMLEFRNDYRRIYTVARTVTVFLVAILGICLFLWARSLAPARPNLAGLLAAALLWFSPGVLAHARLVTTDAGTALFICLAIWSIQRFLQSPTIPRTLLCGLTLGLSQLTKSYALLLYPLLLACGCFYPHSARPGQRRKTALGIAASLAISLLLVNAAYLFQNFAPPLGSLHFYSSRWNAIQQALPHALRLPLPGGFITAFDAQVDEVEKHDPSFLYGKTFHGGRWDYFLRLLPIKTPIPMLALLLLAAILAIRDRLWARREFALLALYPLSLLAILSLTSYRQLGLRMILSAAPLVWLVVAVTLARSKWPNWQRALVAVLALWLIAEPIRTFPNYLPYFNQLVGGSSRGYRYAAESNLDWGQDLPQLKDYLDRTQTERIQLLYFGSVDPEIYGIDFEVPNRSLRPGLLAVSVSLYNRGYPAYDHGQIYEIGPLDLNHQPFGPPIANIANTIHIYRVPTPPGRPANPGAR